MDAPRRTRALLPFALTAVLATGTWACSSATHTRGAERRLVRAESEGLVVEVSAHEEIITHSPGLKEAGRWFGWENGSTTCNVVAVVQTTFRGRPDEPVRVRLETSPRGRLFMDEASCAQRLRAVDAAACASRGRIAFSLDGVFRVVEGYAGQTWMVEAGGDPPSRGCDAIAASYGDTVSLVSRSHLHGACDALLTQREAEAATRCVLDYDSFGIGDTLARDGVVASVVATRNGAPPTSTLVRWAALVSAGEGNGHDFDVEAALYAFLLDGEPDFRAAEDFIGLGLAFAPSRARRTEFLESAIARCEAGRSAEWQRFAVAAAAAGLDDESVSARVARACGVDPAHVRLYFPARVAP